MTIRTSKFAILGFGLAFVTPVAGNAQTKIEANEIIPLTDWSYTHLYDDGISVNKIIYDMEVYGAGGEEIGDVENVLFSPEGQVLSIIAEVGGFWDIGDTHVNIPWDDVEMRPGRDGLNVPVTEDTVDIYGLFPDQMLTETAATTLTEAVEDDLATGPRVWRATELMGDYARLLDGDSYMNYGYVNDIIIRDGEVAAVMVRPAGGMRTPGVYGYPYYGDQYGWTPGAPSYDLPYRLDDVGAVEPFDYQIIEQE